MTPSDPNVSRRALLVLFGVGAAAAGTAVVLGHGASDAAAGVSNAHAHDALGPLTRGTPFARWTVADVGPMVLGAVTVTVVGEAGERFALEVMARDTAPNAPRAVGETKYFGVYLPNGGDGEQGTIESHGLAAMTLAQIIERHETPEAAAPFLALTERLARHADELGAPTSITL